MRRAIVAAALAGACTSAWSAWAPEPAWAFTAGECGDPALPLADRTACETAEDVGGMRVEALAGLGLVLAGVFYRCGAAGGGAGT